MTKFYSEAEATASLFLNRFKHNSCRNVLCYPYTHKIENNREAQKDLTNGLYHPV